MNKRTITITEATGGFVIQINSTRVLPTGHNEYDTETEVATSTDDLINKLNTLFTPTEKERKNAS
jgi:ABC-type transporter Mla subunit MlaD